MEFGHFLGGGGQFLSERLKLRIFSPFPWLCPIQAGKSFSAGDGVCSFVPRGHWAGFGDSPGGGGWGRAAV